MPAFLSPPNTTIINMEEVKTSGPAITTDIKNLVDNYIDLAKANVTQKTADVASFGLTAFIAAMLGIFAVVFAGVGLAWWLGELMENMVLGFLLVAALFIVMVIVLLIFREKLIYPIIRNNVVKKVYE